MDGSVAGARVEVVGFAYPAITRRAALLAATAGTGALAASLSSPPIGTDAAVIAALALLAGVSSLWSP